MQKNTKIPEQSKDTDSQAKSIQENNKTSALLLAQQKTRLQELTTKLNFQWKHVILLWIFIAVIIPIVILLNYEYDILKTPLFWVIEIPSSFILAIFGYYSFFSYFRVLINMSMTLVDKQIASIGVINLQENLEEDFFNKLVKINFKYIDQYYLQTQAQADKSFTLTCVVAALGVGIIISGIVLMFFNKIQPAYITTATGVLSEFIASIFFYLYNKTILKMSEYHQKLVFTQNLSLALKITEELPPEDKIKARMMLIDRLSHDINQHLSLHEECKLDTKKEIPPASISNKDSDKKETIPEGNFENPKVSNTD